MSEEVKNIRLSKAAREFNVGTSTIVEFLAKKGFNIDPSPNTKLSPDEYALVVKEYQGEKEVKKNADQLGSIAFKGKTITVETTEKPKAVEEEEEIVKNDLDMKRLRMHMPRSVEGRLFIQFLASILTAWLREKLREAGWLKNVTLQEVIDEMKSLREVSRTGKRKRLMTTLTSRQQEILKLYRISA